MKKQREINWNAVEVVRALLDYIKQEHDSNGRIRLIGNTSVKDRLCEQRGCEAKYDYFVGYWVVRRV